MSCIDIWENFGIPNLLVRGHDCEVVWHFVHHANDDSSKLLEQFQVCCVVFGLIEAEQKGTIVAREHAEIVDPKPASVVHDVHRFTPRVLAGCDPKGLKHRVIKGFASKPTQTALPDTR